MSLGEKLFHGTFWTTTGAVLSRVMAVITTGILGRILGREDFGDYAIVVSAVLLIGPLAGGAMMTLLERYVSLWKIEDKERCGRTIALALATATVMGCAFTAVAYVGAEQLAAWNAAPRTAEYFRLVAPAMLFAALTAVGNGLLVAYRAYKRQMLVNWATATATLPVTALLVWRYGIPGGVAGFLFSQGMLGVWLVCAALAETRACGVRVRWGGLGTVVPLLWTFGLPALLNLAAGLPIQYVGNVFLRRAPEGAGQMGLFGAANYLRGLVLFLPGAVGPVMLPLMMEAVADRNDPKGFHRVASANLRIVGLLVFPISVFLVAGAKGVLKVIYEQEFVEGWSVLGLVACAVGFQAVALSVGQIMISRARMWHFLMVNLASAALFGAGAFVLVARYGAEGLAACHILAFASQLVLIMLMRAWFLDAPVAGSEWRLLAGSVVFLGLAAAAGSVFSEYVGLGLAAALSALAAFGLFRLGFSRSERASVFGLVRVRVLARLRRRGGRDG